MVHPAPQPQADDFGVVDANGAIDTNGPQRPEI